MSLLPSWSFERPIRSQCATDVPELLKQSNDATLQALYREVPDEHHPSIKQIEPALHASPWVMSTVQKYASALEVIWSQPHWGVSEGHADSLFDDLKNATNEADAKCLLRQQRQCEMVRIAVRDLMGWATLDETLMDLSRLAIGAINAALHWANESLSERYGVPRNSEGQTQHLIVMGMGKMGGGELNFSSDIDLIFFYPEAGETDGRKCVANMQYFTRVGQLLIKLLDEPTADGFVFRVDMRLRPFGESGPLAVNFDSVENYYHTQGREWERYAMIKALPVTGQPEDIAYLRSVLVPFVFRRYVDFSALQSMRDLKAMIDEQVQKKGMENNIKLGRGGIREIEFIGQVFQLVYGGKLRVLQTRSIVTVLQILAQEELLDATVVASLLEAYAFLRFSENRLQMVNDAQTHTLPETDLEQTRLAYAMGFDDWVTYLDALNQHRTTVAKQFAQVFDEKHDNDDKYAQWRALWLSLSNDAAASVGHADSLAEGVSTPSEWLEYLTTVGFTQPQQAFQRLHRLKSSSEYSRATSESQQRLDAFMPILLHRIKKTGGNKDALLERSLALTKSILRRSVYLVLLHENPKALKRLLALIGHSEWLSEQLNRQPSLLDQLVDDRTLYAIERRPELDKVLAEQMQFAENQDEDEYLYELRRFKLAYTFRVAAVDLSERMPLMRVSDHLTECAEVLVEETHRLAWIEMVSRFGYPHGRTDDGVINPSMGIIGYGKLGGIELGYASDLDLVFVHDSVGKQTVTSGREDGKGVIDNTLFFAKLAQKFSSIMNVQTHMGQLYEVDTRLRPDGNSGEWVKSLPGFERYQKEKAWTWEHQALVRARFISGQPALKQAFERIRHEVLATPRDRQQLRNDVVDMREKMRENLGGKDGALSLKQDRGGLTDIEFMVQYLVLGWASEHPELTRWTDNIRILDEIAQVGILSKEESDTLVESYRQIRAKIHRLALDKQKAIVNEWGGLAPAIEAVAHIWQRVMVDDTLG